MKAVVAFLGLLALSQAAPSLNTWELYKAVHNKVYSSAAEESLRKEIFEKNVARIDEHNQKYEAGEESYQQGINQFTDMLTEEVNSMMNGYRSSDKVKSGRVFVADKKGDLPDTVDWREKGAVTDVKDQAECGSCWAFSTTGSTEGQHALSTGNLVSLSEQQLVSCSYPDYGNYGCNGGQMDQAFQYIIAAGGIESEEDYPYVSGNGRSYFDDCAAGKKPWAANITGFVDVRSEDEDALQEAVATIGPISVAIDASGSGFHNYKTGVFYNLLCSSTALDHGVLVVGYGTEVGKDYWLVKNSWAASWGDEGYIKMSRNKNNNCGIATQASYPTV